MTGFGRGVAEGDGAKVSIDVRTVNNRNLDVHVRVPSDYMELELHLRRQIQATFKRGRVDVSVSVARTGQAAFKLNVPVVEGYLEAVRQLKEQFGLNGDITVESVARVPGVIQASDADPHHGGIAEAAAAALTAALAEVAAMRAVEGAELAAEMTARVATIEATLPVIAVKAAELPALYRERLEKRLGDLTRGKLTDEARLAQEIAFMAERSDIAEEIARLRSHTGQFRQALGTDGGEVGKRLDFLLQEMNREANTILSKSGDIGIADAAIAIKTEVEKLREQVQNVE